MSNNNRCTTRRIDQVNMGIPSSLMLPVVADRTQEAYTRALRMLCERYDKVPEEISEV